MSHDLLQAVDKLLSFIDTYDISTERKIEEEDISITLADMSDIPFYRSKHLRFIIRLQNIEHSYEYCQTEHLRMEVLYWALTALDLMNSLTLISNDEKKSIIKFVIECFDENHGGFGGNVGHDTHLLATLSALQILTLFNCVHECLSVMQIQSIVQYISSLQVPETGAFMGDEWGEIDTRFTYAALNALSLLKSLKSINIEKCIQYLHKCRNFDGGYGTKPLAESHTGQIFCCVSSLAILKQLNDTNMDRVNWWLAERQCSLNSDPNLNGGLNGRPMKLPDVCYSWWCLSVMAICDRVPWINHNKLLQFILRAQDAEDGGISDRPNDVPDIYHTFFGIAGISLLGLKHVNEAFGIQEIDPIWALPKSTLERNGIYEYHHLL